MRPINTHEQLMAAGGGIAIMPVYHGVSRAERTTSNGWSVYRIVNGQQISTDPSAPWYCHGRKTFVFHSGKHSKADALAMAQRWVAEQGWYDGQWTRNRMGDYVPSDTNRRFPLPRVK